MTQGLWDYSQINGMHLELTNRCNAACPQCPRYVGDGDELNPKLVETGVTYDQFTKWFDVPFVKQLLKVYACGNYGDPIANKDTLPIYKYLRENGNEWLMLAMHTNGSARTPEWFYELGLLMNSQKRNDYCVFSVDGLEDTNHLYRRNTNWDQIMENIKAYREAGGIAQWDFIVYRHNEHQVETARKLAKDLGFVAFNVKKTTRWRYYENGYGYSNVRNRDGSTYRLEQPFNEDFHDSTVIKIKEIKGITPNYITNEQFARMHSKDSVMYKVHDPKTKQDIEIDHRTIDVSCRAVAEKRGGNGWNDEIFLSAEGEVYPCCFLGGEPNRFDGLSPDNNYRSKDSFMQMLGIIGGREAISLHNKSLREIIEGDLYQRLLPESLNTGHNMRSKQCSSCCGTGWNKLDNGELGNREDAMLNGAEVIANPGFNEQ